MLKIQERVFNRVLSLILYANDKIGSTNRIYMFVSDEEELITTPKKIEKKESCAAALEKGKDGFVQRYLSQNTGGRNKNAIAKRLTVRSV